jgi:hypothetical protein
MRSDELTKPGRGKKIVYRYNGDPKDDEIVLDINGEMPFSRMGEMTVRKGKRWRVAVVRNDLNMDRSAPEIPIHRVFLTDKL